jgi:hypothetical protein
LVSGVPAHHKPPPEGTPRRAYSSVDHSFIRKVARPEQVGLSGRPSARRQRVGPRRFRVVRYSALAAGRAGTRRRNGAGFARCSRISVARTRLPNWRRHAAGLRSGPVRDRDARSAIPRQSRRRATTPPSPTRSGQPARVRCRG